LAEKKKEIDDIKRIFTERQKQSQSEVDILKKKFQSSICENLDRERLLM
jgi:hypothetical protein